MPAIISLKRLNRESPNFWMQPEYIKMVAMGWQATPNGRNHGHVTRLFLILFLPNHIFTIGQTRHFKCSVLIDSGIYKCTYDRLLLKLMYSGSRDILTYWEISDNISETVQWKFNRKSCVAYRMAPLRMPLNDLEVTIAIWYLSIFYTSWHMTRKCYHGASRGPSAVAEPFVGITRAIVHHGHIQTPTNFLHNIT